jgi:hypothetical protein
MSSKLSIFLVLAKFRGSLFAAAPFESCKYVEKNISERYRKGLVVVRFNAKGNFVWGEPLLIEQLEKYDKMSNSWISSIPFIFNNQLNVIYNSVNYKAKKSEETTGNAIFNTHWIEFNKNGIQEKKSISKINDFEGEKMSLMPKLISQDNDGIVFLLQNENKNKFILIKLTL